MKNQKFRALAALPASSKFRALAAMAESKSNGNKFNCRDPGNYFQISEFEQIMITLMSDLVSVTAKSAALTCTKYS